MYAYTHVWGCACPCANMEVRKDIRCPVLSLSALFLWDSVLHWTWSWASSQKSQSSPVSASSSAVLLRGGCQRFGLRFCLCSEASHPPNSVPSPSYNSFFQNLESLWNQLGFRMLPHKSQLQLSSLCSLWLPVSLDICHRYSPSLFVCRMLTTQLLLMDPFIVTIIT